MFKNYLKIAFRNVWKNKTYSIINIFGLAVSMSVCLLIILFFYDQKSFDQFHENKDSIYRVVTEYTPESDQSSSWYATSPSDLSRILETNYSGISEAVTIKTSFGGQAKVDEKTIINLQGFYSDSDFFDVFSFEFIEGNKETALTNPGDLVLTSKAAEKLFGDQDPIGKTVTLLGDRQYQITGILKDGYRSHLNFEAIASSSSQSNEEQNRIWHEDFSYSYTYVLLNKNNSPSNIESKLPDIIGKNFIADDRSISEFQLQAISSINLGRVLNNEIGVIIPQVAILFLAALVLIVIFIASFNYISLTIARSVNRGKEVGVRKVLGAQKNNVFKQFIAESLVTSFLALIGAYMLLQFMLPAFNSLYIISESGTQITTSIESNIQILFVFFAFSILIGFLAGIYPSWHLSKFKPALVLKGLSKDGKSSSGLLRKFVIVSQFSFSIVFIITSIFLYRQFNHLSNTEYGFDREQIINVALQDIPYQRFQDRMLTHPSVQSVAATSKIPALGSVNGMWANSNAVPERIRVNSFEVDENYVDAMGLELLSGRNFSIDFSSDAFSSVILNRNAVQELNLGSPEEAIGKSISINEEPYQVVGVIENFISSSPLQNNDPALLLNNPDNFYYAIVKTQNNGVSQFLPFLQQSWFELDSQYPIQFQIFDYQLKSNPIIAVFNDFSKLLLVLTLFTILITCFGLLGMAINSTENRKKEIALRKVLGASSKSLSLLITREYMILIGLALFIGSSIAYFLNNLWVTNLSNSIDLDVTVFLLGILATSLLALITVGSQTIKASLTNPINSIRNE